jgi:hypothetical protein
MPARVFPLEEWSARVPALAKRYRESRPYPHILLEGFLDPQLALAISKEFPPPTGATWTQYKHFNENKLGLPKPELFPPMLRSVTDELNSPEFAAWVSELTEIPGLIADPTLEGGGLHQSGRGGFLNVHTDFSKHHVYANWRRRVNLILYLNPGWDTAWGGAIELWERSAQGKMARCVAKYPPLLNHALIFTTDERSLHGFPDLLACPEGHSRKSLALYYYTEEGNEQSTGRSTDYFARPQDGWRKSAMIWLDKKALDLYSRAKARFGFSDKVASKMLGFTSRK